MCKAKLRNTEFYPQPCLHSGMGSSAWILLFFRQGDRNGRCLKDMSCSASMVVQNHFQTVHQKSRRPEGSDTIFSKCWKKKLSTQNSITRENILQEWKDRSHLGYSNLSHHLTLTSWETSADANMKQKNHPVKPCSNFWPTGLWANKTLVLENKKWMKGQRLPWWSTG